MTRIGTADRSTDEVTTVVEIRLDDDPTYNIAISATEQEPDIAVAIGKHFFEQLHRFSGFGGTIIANGDLPHHVLEDVAICWGQAFKEALGDRRGIRRTESHHMPMEGVLVDVALDISGRPWATLDFQVECTPMVEMIRHILTTMAMHGAYDLNVKVEWEEEAIRLSHHVIETVAKALGRVFHDATRIEGTEVLSVKGTLD